MPSRLAWVTAATIVGVAMIASGWLVQGTDYVPSVLLEIGATLILVVPIAFLERRLQETGRQLQGVRDRLQRTADEVHRLRQSSVEESYDDREDVLRAAEQQGTQSTIQQALYMATAARAVSRDGVRVPINGLAARMRFRLGDQAAPDTLWIRFEPLNVPEASPWRAWDAGENDRKLMRRLNRDARAMGFGDVVLRDLPLGQLAALLREAVEGRTGNKRDIGTVIELATEKWAISHEGLYGRTGPYFISREDVNNLASSPEDLRQYRAENFPSLDLAELTLAMDRARAAYGAERIGATPDPQNNS